MKRTQMEDRTMKKMTVMIGLALAMILLAGCDGTKKGGSVDPFLGGTNGILLAFMDDAPPGEVFDGGDFPFSIVVTLKNDGERDVPLGKAKLSISGINPAEFGVTDEALVKVTAEALEGSSKDAEGNIIPGTVLLMEFPEMVYAGELVGNRVFPVRANLCYEYGTGATSSLCVRSNLKDTSDSPVCTINEDKTVYSSGAPVAITTFQEAVAGSDKVRFTFTISHKNNGNIYKLGSGCDGAVYANRNKVHVTVDSGLEGLKCSGLSEGDDISGYVTLSTDGGAGERVITCTQPIESQTDFDQPVNIELTYDYKDHIDTELLVKHAGE